MYKGKIVLTVISGILISGALMVSAWTEPSLSPDQTTSSPPINLGPITQYHYGSLGIGDGENYPDNTFCSLTSLCIKNHLLSDSMTVRQNANFVSDVNIGKRNIIAGALRVAQISLNSSVSKAQSYTDNDPKLYFPDGSTTNLMSGNYCSTAVNAECWPGTFLYKYDPSSSVSICRSINPVKTSVNSGKCPVWSGETTINNDSINKNTNSCIATLVYKSDVKIYENHYGASGSHTSTTTLHWYLKGINETEWTLIGSSQIDKAPYYNKSPSFTVPINNNTPSKIYDLKVVANVDMVGTQSYTYQTGSRSFSSIKEILTVQENTCQSQGGSGPSSNL